MKKILFILLIFLPFFANGQPKTIYFLNGHVYYVSSGLYIQLDSTIIRILGIKDSTWNQIQVNNEIDIGNYSQLNTTDWNYSTATGKTWAIDSTGMHWGGAGNPDTTKFGDNHFITKRKLKDEIYVSRIAYDQNIYLRSIYNNDDQEGSLNLGKGFATIEGDGTTSTTNIHVDSINAILQQQDTSIHTAQTIVTFERMKKELKLTSNILSANNTTHTFEPYASKQAGINLYTGTTDPDGTTRLNLNGDLHPTTLYAKTTATSYEVAVVGSASNIEGGAGGSFISSGNSGTGLRASYSGTDDENGKASYLYTSGGNGGVLYALQSGSTSGDKYTAAITLKRNQSGTGNLYGNLLDIIDNPTTTGIQSGNLISGTIGSTIRFHCDPRVRANSDSIAYLFSSSRTLASTAKLFEFQNNGTAQLTMLGSGITYFNQEGFLIRSSSGADTAITVSGSDQSMIIGTSLGGGSLGINVKYTNHLIDLAGGAYCDGTGDWIAGSDTAFKFKIKPLTKYGLKDVLKLQPITYIHKKDANKKVQLGFSAQDMVKVIPEIVDGKPGEYGIAYNRLIPVLVNSIKDLNKKIEDQQKLIDQLTRKISQQDKDIEMLKEKFNNSIIFIQKDTTFNFDNYPIKANVHLLKK